MSASSRTRAYLGAIIGGWTGLSSGEPQGPSDTRPTHRLFLGTSGTIESANTAEPSSVSDPTVIRRRWVGVDLEALDAQRRAPADVLIFDFFGEVSLRGVVRRVENKSPSHYRLFGTLIGEALSSFTIVVHDGRVTANVLSPAQGSFQIRRHPGGGHKVREIDESRFRPCRTDSTDVGARLAPQTAAAVGGCGDDGSFIDVLVVYTAAARSVVGGTDAMLDLIDLAEAESLQAYLNSNITTTQLRVVSTYEVNYAESGDSQTDRAHLMDPSDGVMDEVHPLRDSVAADVVSLWVNTLEVCGRAAFSIASGNYPIPELAFSVVAWDCATGNYTFAHEIGHNQGCRHDRLHDNSDDGAFLYSHGYFSPGNTFRTIMGVRDAGSTIPRIQYFSNPAVLYFGVPTGIAEGDSASADNATTILNTAFNVANFRSSTPPDCNDNGLSDADDIAGGTSLDLNADGVPDECSRRLYVRSGAVEPHDGSSWGSAFAELRDALVVAALDCGSITEVWVAQGTYAPADADVSAGAGYSFRLANGLALYGGFVGFEVAREQRDPAAHPTILTGDLNGDDGITVPAASGSDCCTGHAGLGCDTQACEDAICSNLPQCCSTGWTQACATRAASLCCNLCAPNMNLCENSYHVVQATGVDETAILDGFTITGGRSHQLPTPRNNGAGVYMSGARPTIARCTFLGNSALTGGAGMYVTEGSRPIVLNSKFLSNLADQDGGAVGVNFGSQAVFVNCYFAGNRASALGSVIRNGGVDVSTTTFINCTLYGNLQGFGAAVYSYPDSVMTLHNSILWQNRRPTVLDESTQLSGGIVSIDRSCVQGWTGTFGGMGNFGSDPLLTNPAGADAVVGTNDDDLHLQAGSPCIDAGDASRLPPDSADLDEDGDAGEPVPLDLAGALRRFDDVQVADTGPGPFPMVDIGAYERVIACIPCEDADVCTLDTCDLDGCYNTAILYGDVNADGFVNSDDLLCELDTFATVFNPASCLQSTPQARDISPCPGGAPNTMGDGFVNTDDALAVLDKFGGIILDPACDCP